MSVAFVALVVLILFRRRLPATVRVLLTAVVAIRWPWRALLWWAIYRCRPW